MTARNVRVVRAGPGEVSDRRGSVRFAVVSSSSSQTKEASPVYRDVARVLPRGGLVLPSTAQGDRGAERSRTSVDTVRVPRSEVSDLCEVNRHCGTLELLVALEGVECATQYELRRKVHSGYCAFDGSLKCLVRLDLVRIERETAFPFRLRYRLTDSGRAFASALVNWERSTRHRDTLSR